jgi:DNA-binding transcriptional LysR family regulator
MMAAELGTLSKVAERSNLALAAVSRRISQLEHIYGVRLLDRKGRGVTLTPAGLNLVEHARGILQRVNATRADMAEFAGGLKGSIRVHASTSAITQFLPADLAAFAEQRPELRVDLREGFTPDIAQAVRSGVAEVGILVGDVGLGDLETAVYRRDRLVIVAREDDVSLGPRVCFADVDGRDLVLMEEITATTRLLRAIAAREGRALRIRAQVNSFDAVCRMVQSGFGLGFLPEGAARNIVAPLKLRLVEIEDDWAERTMLLCASKVHPMRSSAREIWTYLRFVEAAMEQIMPD